ncbi:hypothetical protein MRB53_015223 [Persea americana]|uniref:Uncharacterized protein n=1 Tax=Persea americana TaxID=3435 RepID=A0ACC2KDI0_PERAE|nr:hypothetical protein MRB53_015223 [Persea americana]
MEVVPPVAATDFHFDSTCSSPYMSAPSSPKAFGHFYSSFYSAPTSPTRSAVMPFDWEDTPPPPKSTTNNVEEDDDPDYDFAFDFSGQLREAPQLTAAEELFDRGKIRPLKPPPRLQLNPNGNQMAKSPNSSPKSPNIFRNAFSPRKKRDFDPFAAAIEKTTKGSDRERGRERKPISDPSNPSRREARSLSPLRAPDSKPTSSSSSKGNSRKWRLRDFLLFRSASEGRATDKDTLRKYGVLPKKGAEDVKNASFRSTDSGGSGSGSRRGPVSAHEIHYTVNRAVSEEMKRKTFLPYRQGLFGCLGFNPAVHGIAKGFDGFRNV